MRKRNSSEEWNYIDGARYIARHVLGEDERGDLLIPCVCWSKQHNCYDPTFGPFFKNIYNPRNLFHWRFKAMSFLLNKVVWVERG